MTDYLDPGEDEPDPGEDEPVDGSRRRAVWGLVVLGCLALIIGSLMVLLGGGSAKKKDTTDLAGPPVTSTPTSSSRTTASVTGTTPKPTSTVPSSPPRTGNPCAGQATCGVAGDGGVVAALNAYRTTHGQTAVTGSATAAAQTCAEHNGSAQFCAEHWIYTTVGSQNGQDCVKGFAGFNPSWLLDKRMTSFSVGWAYVNGSYQCAVTERLSTD